MDSRINKWAIINQKTHLQDLQCYYMSMRNKLLISKDLKKRSACKTLLSFSFLSSLEPIFSSIYSFVQSQHHFQHLFQPLSHMAYSSTSSNIKRYHVFPSFHGPDVRRSFLSHLHKHFESTRITMFKDHEIERGHTIGPELVQAIRESRVLIVVLSKRYASSSWCLDELVEILKCKKDLGLIVMTIFYKVDPSYVRKQRGGFGSTFEKTCEGKTEEVKLRWSKALTDIANIEGEYSLNWYVISFFLFICLMKSVISSFLSNASLVVSL